ncbi:DUF6301 family protein [Nocardia yamanashiensis]|uniref:DUF6301 family protein n=1 Tax=Nocardia yamanashiensis TaxID=209247 RepID=UPI0012FDF733|nr:DUF6301 family protein [Nocardia yamanashiensis]
MSETVGAGLADVVRFACTAAGFEAAWTRADLREFLGQLGWPEPEEQWGGRMLKVRAPESVPPIEGNAYFFDENALSDLTLEILRSDDAATSARIASELSAGVSARLGAPEEPAEGEHGPSWVSEFAAITLQHNDSGVYLTVRPRAGFDRARRERADAADGYARLSDWSPLVEAISLLVQAVPGAWTSAEMTELAESVGWGAPAVNRAGDIRADLTTPGASARLLADRAQRPLTGSGSGFGEFMSIEVSQSLAPAVIDAAYRAALAECVRLLGAPPLVGGPHAFARWRGPEAIFTLSRELAQPARLRFEVQPTEATEQEAYLNQKWSEDWIPDACWSVVPDREDESLRTAMDFEWPGAERQVTDWSDFEYFLKTLFHSMAADMPQLHPHAGCVVWSLGTGHAADGWLAQGWFRDTDCRLEFQEPEGLPCMLDFPPGAASGDRIAEAVLATLHGHGITTPDQLWCHAFAAGQPQHLWSLRTGLRHR